MVTNDDGTMLEGEIELSHSNGRTRSKRSRSASPRSADTNQTPPAVITPDFSLPIRPFMNRYARGRSGPQAFTLLVARLAEGEVGREVRADEVRREWSRMTGILGDFATMYGTRAKNEALVDSPQRGVFVLLADWTNALG